MIGTKRFPLRNCIRRDTYRYCMEKCKFQDIWKALSSRFGEPRQFGSLDLYEINTPSFLLRGSLHTASVTLIKKKGLEDLDLDQFHQIVDFDEKRDVERVS